MEEEREAETAAEEMRLSFFKYQWVVVRITRWWRGILEKRRLLAEKEQLKKDKKRKTSAKEAKGPVTRKVSTASIQSRKVSVLSNKWPLIDNMLTKGLEMHNQKIKTSCFDDFMADDFMTMFQMLNLTCLTNYSDIILSSAVLNYWLVHKSL